MRVLGALPIGGYRALLLIGDMEGALKKAYFSILTSLLIPSC